MIPFVIGCVLSNFSFYFFFNKWSATAAPVKFTKDIERAKNNGSLLYKKNVVAPDALNPWGAI